MQRYSKLVGADIYRDGGSLEVQFMRSDGAFETLWLQVHPDWLRGRGVHYSRLEIYGDLERRVTPCIVEIGSETEKDIVAGLGEFLGNPVVDVPFAHRKPKEHFLQHVRDLFSQIPRRGQSAEPDGAGNSHRAGQ
jgi:hypothetical protein